MDSQDSTKLSSRTLRFDGISILDPYQVEDFLLRGLKVQDIRITRMTPEINQFNANVIFDDRIRVLETEELKFDQSWKLPTKYLELDIDQHVLAVFGERVLGLEYDSAQIELAITRVALELQEFKARKLENLLRTIVFVLDRFKETGQIYGVGRGSSCASYVLFLLGLHVVDSILYNVPIEEFFH